MKDIKRIVEVFPHPTIIPIIGIPTYKTLAEVNLQLNSNTASVHLELVNGQLGLLELAVTAPVYLTLADVSFFPPVNPLQVVIPPRFVRTTIAALQTSHSKKTSKWKEYLAVDNALKNNSYEVSTKVMT